MSKIEYNGSQINTVKDMKEQILDIADKLRNEEINSDEAQNLLLCLFDVSGSSLKLDDWDKLVEKEILILNHDNGSFKKGDEFLFKWSDGISLVVVSNNGNDIYLDRASILFFNRKEQLSV